jgi:Ca-activated chloride channel homolog
MPYSRTRVCALVSMVVALFVMLPPSAARADGFIIVRDPHPVPGHFPFAPLEVSFHRVKVDIEDRVAVTTVDQEFRNPGSQRTEGTYLFPLPPGASIDKFAMDVNGEMVEAELLKADKARHIYEEIVRKQRDPALLEYVGRDAFKCRIFPIEPHGTKRVKIKYTQVLKEDAGLCEYVYPLNTEKFSSKPLGDVSVVVNVKSSDAIKNIYCPTHEAEIKRKGEREAKVGYEEKNARPDTDFKLLFSRETKKDVDVRLLSYRDTAGGEGEESGYFMLMASPGDRAADTKPRAKDIVFVLDTSGSMAEKGKLDQAKRALNFCIANLNEDDRFNIVRFSTEAEPFFAELERPQKERLERTRKYIDGLKPTGGTAIDDALEAALKCRQSDGDSEGRPFLIVFLTDGAPTVGVTNEDQIVRRVNQRAEDVRVFCFGIGHDVNTHLLDRIADATRAASNYVAPDEDIEVKVSSFYGKIKEPALTDVKVSFDGADVRVTQLYPSKLPDLFKGETLLLFGRYRGDARAASVRVRGNVDGKPREFAEDVKFADSDTSHGFIPRLWATRRVGWLLDEIRLHGESKELKDEVVKLAREHGIVTPYTAYLIVEDEAKKGIPQLSRTFQDFELDTATRDRAKYYYDSTVTESAAPSARAGEQAVANARNYGALKAGSNLQQQTQGAGQAEALVKPPAAVAADAVSLGAAPATQPEAVTGYKVARNYAQQARVVNGKAFYQNGARWSDAAAQRARAEQTKIVRFNSDEYFELVRNNTAAAQWLSLGNEVDVVIGDTLYQVREN